MLRLKFMLRLVWNTQKMVKNSPSAWDTFAEYHNFINLRPLHLLTWNRVGVQLLHMCSFVCATQKTGSAKLHFIPQLGQKGWAHPTAPLVRCKFMKFSSSFHAAVAACTYVQLFYAWNQITNPPFAGGPVPLLH